MDEDTSQEITQEEENPLELGNSEAVSDQSAPPEVSDSPTSDTSPPDPYEEKIAALQQRLDSYEQQFKGYVGQRQPSPLSARVPAAINKRIEEMTGAEFEEVQAWKLERRAEQLADEAETKAKLNAKELGPGNDYRSVIEKWLAPAVEHSPQLLSFVQSLDAESRYMLGLMYEINAKYPGDIIKVIKALRGGAHARMQGAADQTKQVNQAAHKHALRVVQGAGGRQSHDRELTPEQIQGMPHADFMALKARING